MAELVWETTEYEHSPIIVMWTARGTLHTVGLMRNGMLTACVPFDEMRKRLEVAEEYLKAHRG